MRPPHLRHQQPHQPRRQHGRREVHRDPPARGRNGSSWWPAGGTGGPARGPGKGWGGGPVRANPAHGRRLRGGRRRRALPARVPTDAGAHDGCARAPQQSPRCRRRGRPRHGPGASHLRAARARRPAPGPASGARSPAAAHRVGAGPHVRHAVCTKPCSKSPQTPKLASSSFTNSGSAWPLSSSRARKPGR